MAGNVSVLATDFRLELEADEVFATPFCGKALLYEVKILNEDGDQFTMELFRRALSAGPVDLLSVRADPAGGTGCVLKFAEALEVKPGDRLVVADSGVVAYDGNHVVVESLSGTTCLVDTIYAGDTSNAGSVAFETPADQEFLHRVGEEIESDGAGVVELVSGVNMGLLLFVNRDPVPRGKGGGHNLYLRSTVSGTYRVSLVGEQIT